ncbi:MAG: 5'/3'-nucleotidase SurE [Brevinema sp.]
MKILFSNDDGYEAIGIQTLYKEFASTYDSYMCAPLKHKSAFSHAINYYDHLKLVPLSGNIKGFALDSTPADCVRVALLGIFEEKFDLVLSGINYGMNASQDVFYSGTVGAAREAVFSNLLSIACSLDLEGNNNVHIVDTDIEQLFQYASKMMKSFVQAFTPEVLNYRGSLININFPSSYPAKGIKVVRLGWYLYHNILDHQTNANDHYIRIDTKSKSVASGQNTDAYYLEQGYITITALDKGVVWDETLHKLLLFLEEIPVNI